MLSSFAMLEGVFLNTAEKLPGGSRLHDERYPDLKLCKWAGSNEGSVREEFIAAKGVKREVIVLIKDGPLQRLSMIIYLNTR